MNPAAGVGSIPRATYRFQLGPDFGFRQIQQLLPYLGDLGISHLYLSPIFRARRGSTHGYDVTDHGRINDELGTRADLEGLASAARTLGIGIILDIVPNHMAVMTRDNVWWMDVLENGRSSHYANFFDIDWNPGRESMRNRLLVPVLGSTFGETIERGEIQVVFDADNGSLDLTYQEQRFPLDPRHYPLIFRGQEAKLARWSHEDPDRQDFDSLLDAFAELPPAEDASADAAERRHRDKEVNKRRLVRICERRPDLPGFLADVLVAVNGEQGKPESFDSLTALLEAQPYRLAFWRVSGEEINYRRFFDVNDLAALRMEEPAVFDATHALLAELASANIIQGVRVDHADGLHNPKRYFERLREALQGAAQRPYVVAEKILGAGETLRNDWQIDGTTGYEFGGLLTGWLMQSDNFSTLERIYHRCVGDDVSFDAIIYQSKKEVMRSSLAAEISVLAGQLDRVAQMHRSSSDFTQFDLREAVVEVIACFPVYRTYISGVETSSDDRQIIRRAVGLAQRRRGATRRSLEFLRGVLCGELPGSEQRLSAAIDFTMKFQQVTSPVMAKGVEDTGFYRYSCLLALNEVGGDPRGRAVSTEVLHRENLERARNWPHCMLTSATHDSKRGEDARYRLATLSEMPDLWRNCLVRWRRLKRRSSTDHPVSAQDEYLLLQTVLSIWPAKLHVDAAELASLRARLQDYAVKAAREAKLSTSWLDPDAAYEAALGNYINMLLPDSGANGFLRYFQPILERAAWYGTLNMLSATVLKIMSPGVPDIYQGTEVPRFVLVDPDNRQRVDYDALRRGFEAIRATADQTSWTETASRLLHKWRSGDLKLFLTWRLLQLRRAEGSLFAGSGYLPLVVHGEHANHVCAFARFASPTAGGDPQSAGRCVIVMVSRWAGSLMPTVGAAPLGALWQHTQVELPDDIPAGRYFDALTGSNQQLPEAGPPRLLELADCFETLPVAVLVRIAGPEANPGAGVLQ